MEQSETVYTVMDAPELPVIEAELFEDQANRLVGYTQDMGNEVARDSLTILPENRQLKLRLKYGTETPLSTSYEIRSLDKQRLVEKTEAGQWQTAEDGTEELTLPIQNLLIRGTEYLLHVTMETESQRELLLYEDFVAGAEPGAVHVTVCRRIFCQNLVRNPGKRPGDLSGNEKHSG